MGPIWLSLSAVLVLAGLWGGSARAADTVLVFAAASLKTALDEVAMQYEAETGHDVTLSYAGSSALARQIEAGAPVDVFLSANPDWVDRLVDQGLVRPGDVVPLLTNRLALVAPAQDARVTGIEALPEALVGGRLAMALVEAVPAGIYGKQALNTLGLWPALMDHVAQTDNVSAALRLVALGEAPLGIVYQTDAQAEPRVRLVGLFPEDSHDPIIYPAVRLGDADHDFFDYLHGPAAAEVFSRNGFGLVSQAP
ncbi:molybdate ABC transporter substrate-binding protein [Ruegeria sp. 2205SS24-7]|uniref:molybdate ABC transporter substrate-binding protein n=1 Tax=Ruegeria discodermiae TaxID=3064389 RepID=UPI0027407349|nr:molybdate ABC transporter substrate-binding protein [Ruegeria sp. 2205SS24-7]MDP5220317.1 molybdate ABC transporter substrate-binding protein [Ruegeria sp. 2205SS24-7]